MSFEPGSGAVTGSVATLEFEWVFRALWRRRLLAASIFGAVMLAAGLYTAFATPMYEATALLLVKLGREYVYQDDVGNAGSAVVPKTDESLINSEIQILRSAEVVKGVVEAIGVDTLYPSLAAAPPPGVPLESVAAARLLANLIVGTVKDADVIQVTLRTPDPQVTARAVNMLVDLFKEKHLEAFGEPQATAFLEAQSKEASDDLKAAETALVEFQAEHPQFSLEDRDAILLRERTELGTALMEVENEIVAARQRALTQSSTVVSNAQDQLLKLRLEERTLLNTHNEDSRQVENVRHEIALVEGFLKDQTTDSSGRNGQEISLLTARKQKIDERLAGVEDELKNLPELTQRYRELTRDAQTKEANYKRIADRFEKAQTSAEMDRQKIANISVIQPAYAPLVPASPQPMLNLAAAVIVGGGLAVGAALLTERLSQGA